MPNFYVIHDSNDSNPDTDSLITKARELPNIVAWYDTDYVGHAKYLAKKVAKTASHSDAVILVIGGDNTLNDALNGALQVTRKNFIPIAFVAKSNQNIFPQAAGIKTGSSAIEQIKKISSPKYFSVGKITGDIPHPQTHYFINQLGIGFSAAVRTQSHEKNRWRKWFNRVKWGKLSTYIDIISIYARQNAFQMTITTDKNYQVISQAFFATLMNQPYFTARTKLLPDSSLESAQLDLIVVEKRSYLSLLQFYLSLKKNEIPNNSKYIHHFILKPSSKIHVTDIQPSQSDGQELGTGSFSFSIDYLEYPFWIN